MQESKLRINTQRFQAGKISPLKQNKLGEHSRPKTAAFKGIGQSQLKINDILTPGNA